MTAHARRFGRQCREHFGRPDAARAAEPKPDAEAVPAPEQAAKADQVTEEQVQSGK
ncbi:hypothetical protein [Amycolatopsis echigonensis]|uniref:Uncharacterized protein n=1 Tax=Amycolatopsis echigonensis TaxID=2576905 RepID=A0A2N3X0G8_9PSEU|nr:hypothetical protein [Amycolatopsis niigatensis]PKV99609.1 hypothetical protein ATK30_0591 [Amycolatopsis niigatensis]